MVSAQHSTLCREVHHSRADKAAFVCLKDGADINYSSIRWICSFRFQHQQTRLFVLLSGNNTLGFRTPRGTSGNPVITTEKQYFELFSALGYYTRKTNWSLQLADKTMGHEAALHDFFSLLLAINNHWGKAWDIIWGEITPKVCCDQCNTHLSQCQHLFTYMRIKKYNHTKLYYKEVLGFLRL